MTDRSVQRSIQSPAKPVGDKSGKAAKTAKDVPAVVRRGRLTRQQVRRAVDRALRGQTFEADA